MGEPTDAELVTAAQRGDHTAVDTLLSRHLPLIYNIVGRALAGHPDTDDVVQETMIRAIEGLGSLRDPTRFRSWLVTVAIRQVKDRARRHGLRAPLDERADTPDPGVDVAEQAAERTDRQGEQRRFLAAVRLLDDDDRQTLALWWQEIDGRLSRTEVAAALGLSRPHAAVRIQRMRSRLARAHHVLSAWAARPRCLELSVAADDWDGSRLPAAMVRHVRGCPVCRVAGRGLLPPESQVRGIGAAVLPTVAAGGGSGLVKLLATAAALSVAVMMVPTVRGETPRAAPTGVPAVPAVVAPAPTTAAPARSTSPAAAPPSPISDFHVFHVAKTGDDRNDGTEDAPLGTVNRAIALAGPGDTILLRDGFHRVTAPLEITTDGTADQPITLAAYPGEKPSIDAGQVPADGPFVTHRADHWIVRGLDIWGADGDAYACVSCSGNVFEGLTVHGNQGSAFTVSGAGASGNRIAGSDLYDNADVTADGITFAAGSGDGNTVTGCRTFDNGDDGVAVEGFRGAVTVDGTWSYRNGGAQRGTGHGFDLGAGPAAHTVVDSAAWRNHGDAFTGGGATHRLSNSTAFRNAGEGFAFDAPVRLRADLALGNDEDVRVPDTTDAEGNSWQLPGWTYEALRETSSTTAEAERPTSGALPPTSFLTNNRNEAIGAPMKPR